MGEDNDVTIGTPAPASGVSGLLGNRWVLLGGAGILVAAVVLLARRNKAPATGGADTTAPGTLTPDATIALGSLEQQVRERSGSLEQIIGAQGDSIASQLGSATSDILSSNDAQDMQFLGAIDSSTRAIQDQLSAVDSHLVESLDSAQHQIQSSIGSAAARSEAVAAWDYAKQIANSYLTLGVDISVVNGALSKANGRIGADGTANSAALSELEGSLRSAYNSRF